MREEIQLAEDRVMKRPLVQVALGGILSMLIAIGVAWWILVAETGSIRHGDAKRPFDQPGPKEISGERQTLIQDDREGLRLQRRGRDRLDRYEWLDRDQGLVRIPIRRAMELRAKGTLP